MFVMGDNRGDSHDSRFFGPIDEDLIVGRAFVRVWPLTDSRALVAPRLGARVACHGDGRRPCGRRGR